MNFGDFFENVSGARIVADIPYGCVPPPDSVAASHFESLGLSKSLFGSPALSLALSNVEGRGNMGTIGGDFESSGGRSKDDENESKSGSDDVEGELGDDQDAKNPPKKKRYHRHTPQQIQELEALFKHCPHPDEKQRLELSKRLYLDTRKVKFWFQNRRTQMKMQLERRENSLLRQENERLRAENMSIRDAMRNPTCSHCGGQAMLGEVSLEEQHLRMENAWLKDELHRACVLAGKFLGRPLPTEAPSASSQMPLSCLDRPVGCNEYGDHSVVASTMATVAETDFGVSAMLSAVPEARPANLYVAERSSVLDLALAAMDELVRMVQTDEPLWLPSPDGGKEILNYEEYLRKFPRLIGQKPAGFVTEATRDIGMVIVNSVAFVETLMDVNCWAQMFPSLVARASTTDVISIGMDGTRNGAVQLMHAELQVLSPLVPVREVNFLRFCKLHAEGIWVVVDVSIDGIKENQTASPYTNCRRLPSGCLIQHMPNGHSKVTWIEHAEYDDSAVHQLYRTLLSSGTGFGAHRWLSALKRQCECITLLMSSAVPTTDPTVSGRRSMLKLAQRMTNNFCTGVCASAAHQWTKLTMGSSDEYVQMMIRKSVDDHGEAPGIVLSAATSVWFPVSLQRLFDFLRDGSLRCQWDILSNNGPMQEMAHLAKGQDPSNCVSLLQSTAIKEEEGVNPSCILILQETCMDASGALVVYAPVDVPSMHVVMSGGDSGRVVLLPSGFAIAPDGMACGPYEGHRKEGGSLLTVAFQILVNHLPSAKLTESSVDTVKNVISCTVQRIKAALHCES